MPLKFCSLSQLQILKGLLQGGFDGGVKAEQMFRNSVTDILKERGVQMGFRGPAVLIQLYGDVKDLAQGYYAKGFITSPADFAAFQSGFSVAHPLSRFDDVGNSNAWWIGRKCTPNATTTMLTRYHRDLPPASQ